jgi:hypothetical protein
VANELRWNDEHGVEVDRVDGKGTKIKSKNGSSSLINTELLSFDMCY